MNINEMGIMEECITYLSIVVILSLSIGITFRILCEIYNFLKK